VPSKGIPRVCQWVNLQQAFRAFVRNEYGHQGQSHIKPLHWYTACRLVLEGGFRPEEITPRPPFVIEKRRGANILTYDPAIAGGGERTVLGGLKTKNIDVTVTKNGLGPCIAVSHKGVLGAFRNLTNRMEEAVGDCTNIHITYPALVYGYFVAIRANRRANLHDSILNAADDTEATPEEGHDEPNSGAEEFENEEITETAAAIGGEIVKGIDSGDVETADLAVHEGGQPAAMIARFHQAMQELSGRKGVRNDVSRYEAIAMALADPSEASCGNLLSTFPLPESPLRFERFFSQIYVRYDERFVYGAPDLKKLTRRIEWSGVSPVFQHEIASTLDYEPRLAARR
jgi:hypothetical protein